MTRWVEGDAGVRIAISDSGGVGTPVVFVHGFAHHRHVWEGVVERLASGVRAIRMDLRGHGDSGWSLPGDYAVDDYARDIPQVLDALDIERAALVAHSLGGNAATLASAAAPDRISALALVDTGPSLSWAGMMQVASGIAEALRSYATLAEFRATLDLTYPLAEASALDRLAEGSVVERRDGRVEPRLDPAVLGGTLDPGLIAALEARLWEALGQLDLPTLIVRGATSAMLPQETAERMLEMATCPAHLDTIERAGHSVMLDAPAALAERIDAFLSEARTTQPETASRWVSTASSHASRLSSCG